MGKLIDETISVAMHAGAVRDKLTDPELICRMAMAGGASNARATVDGDTTTIVRTIMVPASARAMLRADTIEVTERRVWQAFGADITLEVEGIDVAMTGHLELRETGDHSVLHFNATVTAHMGFATPLVETMLRERLIEQFRAEAEALR